MTRIPLARRVSEERFTEVLGRADHDRGLMETNPVAALLVESMAATHPDHADGVRDAGTFVLDLLRANEPATPKITLSVAMHVLSREEFTPLDDMRGYLASLAERDLLLGISAQALLAQPSRLRRRRERAEHEAVVRTLYLLLRMVETQDDTDALARIFELEEAS